MSDFLINLARRSAGLAPMVQSRLPPLAESVTDGTVKTGGDEAAGRVESVLAHTLTVTPQPPQPLRVVAPASEVPPPSAVVPPMTTPVPVVQRTPAATPALPVAPATPTGIVRAESAPVAVPGMPVTIEPAPAAPVPHVLPAAPPWPASPLIERRIETRIEVETPALESRGLDQSTDARPAVLPAVRERELVHEETRLERLIEPAAPTTAPAVVSIEPAPAAGSVPVALRDEPAAERTVYVRIGAIEIHGTPPTAAPPPPSSPSAPATHSPPATGFDEFTRLRSYAPWGW